MCSQVWDTLLATVIFRVPGYSYGGYLLSRAVAHSISYLSRLRVGFWWDDVNHIYVLQSLHGKIESFVNVWICYKYEFRDMKIYVGPFTISEKLSQWSTIKPSTEQGEAKNLVNECMHYTPRFDSISIREFDFRKITDIWAAPPCIKDQ